MANPFETEFTADRDRPFSRPGNIYGSESHLFTGATGASLGWAESVGRPELEPFAEAPELDAFDDESLQVQAFTNDEQTYRGRGPRYERSDEGLREAICERLTDDEYVDPSDVSISVKDGEVTLEGMVSRRFMKYRIEDLVDSFTGVKEIHNRITVAPKADVLNTVF